MNLSYDLLKKHIPTLNERDHEEKDFFRIWRNRKIYYSEDALDKDICGYYEVDTKGREHIVLNSQVRGTERLLTMAHETTHSYLDQPIHDELVKLFRSLKVLQARQDITAETLGLILIFSLPTLKRFMATGEIHEYLAPYVDERISIFELYGI